MIRKFLAIVGLAASILGSSDAFAQTASPKLQLPNPVFDFGTVREGTSVEAIFLVRNDGDAPLEVKRVQTACGCTGAFLDTPIVQPGQQTQLKVQFDTTGFLGPKVKTVRLHTNEIDRSSAVVTLRGTIQPEIEVDPIRVSFGEVRRGAFPTRFFRVFSDAVTTVEVKEIASRSEHLALEIQDLNERGKIGKLVTVRLLESTPLGPFRGRILVRTTSKRVPLLNVNVFARVSGDVDVSPSEIAFGLMEGPLNADVSQRVEIRGATGGALKILRAESENSAVHVDIRALQEERAYELVVSLPEGTEGVIRTRINVEIEHPDPAQRLIVIPVYAIVSKKGD